MKKESFGERKREKNTERATNVESDGNIKSERQKVQALGIDRLIL